MAANTKTLKDTSLKARLSAALKEKDVYAKALSDANKNFSEKVLELSILRSISDSISSSLDEKTVCTSIVNIIISEMTAENCSIMLVSEDGKSIVMKAVQSQTDAKPTYFADASKIKGHTSEIKIGEGIAGWAAKTLKPKLVTNSARSKKFEKFGKELKNITSLLCLPIIGKDGLVGVLNLSHPEIGKFSRENERLLTLLVSQTALAFDNIRFFSRIKKFSEELEGVVAERTMELRDSEQKYISLMRHGSDAVFIASTETGEIMDCNNEAAKLTGLKSEKWAGKNLKQLFPPDHKEFVKKLMGLVKNRKRHLKRDCSIVKYKKKTTIPVSIHSNVIKMADGHVIYIAMRDITKRLLLDQKLKNYSNQLEVEVKKRTRELLATQNELIHAAKLAALGEMASGVAHEINNPVAIIRGYAEDLRDRIGKGKTINEGTLINHLGMIINNADRCHKITTEILDFSKPRPQTLESSIVGEIISASIEMLKPRLSKAKIDVKADGNGLGTVIKTDSNYLEQVFINLLNNAVDASNKYSIIEIKAREGKENLLVCITDFGKGIPRGELKKIFDPFYSTKEKGEGTGLGLSISYRIVEMLGGSISVASQKGKTTFTVTLPIQTKTKGT